MDRDTVYRQWLRQRREILPPAPTDLVAEVMSRLDRQPPQLAVPPQPPAPAVDVGPQGMGRIAAAAGLLGLGLFRLIYVGASLLVP